MLEGKTVTVEAIEDHPYDGVDHKAGEQYEAQADHLDYLMTTRGWVRLAPAAVPADVPPAASPKPAARKK